MKSTPVHEARYRTPCRCHGIGREEARIGLRGTAETKARVREIFGLRMYGIIDGITRLTSQSDRSVILRFAGSSLVQAHRMASSPRDLSADPEPVSRVATVLKYCSPWVALWVSKASSDSSLLLQIRTY